MEYKNMENIKETLILIHDKYDFLNDEKLINQFIYDIISNFNLKNKNIKKELYFKFEKKIINYLIKNYKLSNDVLNILNNYINQNMNEINNVNDTIINLNKLGEKLNILINVITPEIYIQLLKSHL